jgi:hypothetical protein
MQDLSRKEREASGGTEEVECSADLMEAREM